MRDHLEFWNKIGASQFILNIILYGYSIPFYALPRSIVLKHYMSALKESPFVKDAIKDLWDRNLLEKMFTCAKVGQSVFCLYSKKR